MTILFLVLVGLMTGSFLAAYSYRYPREIPISKGRSKCPHCKHQIAWYDNIPLFSFIILRGKCRNCNTKISIHYALIEATTAVLFVSAYMFLPQITGNLSWIPEIYPISLVIVLILLSLLLAVFFIDAMSQLIPDVVVFSGLLLILTVQIWTGFDLIPYLLSGAMAGGFLLLVHLITRGTGMGLGDVKLALFVGTMLGPHATLIWMLLGFILGAVSGIVLLLGGSVKLKERIAFGPFLVMSFFIVVVWGKEISLLLLPI